MTTSLDEQMQVLGVDSIPARWGGLSAGPTCEAANPELYDRIHAQYDCFPTQLQGLRDAARQVRANEVLSAFLALLCAALEDPTDRTNELREFQIPEQYPMLPALAVASMIPEMAARLSEKGVPEDILRGTAVEIDRSLIDFADRSNGALGMNALYLRWCLKFIDGKILNVGRLNFEMTTFRAHARVFRRADGEITALVDDLRLHKSGAALGTPGRDEEDGAYDGMLTESEDGFTGYPVFRDGHAAKQPVFLPRSTWKPVLQFGDPVVSVHIPGQGRFDPATVEASYAAVKALFADCYPDYSDRAFVCNSWLMDPALQTILKPSSNIVLFQARYSPLPSKGNVTSALNNVFHMSDLDQLETLPEDTSLQRAIKARYLNGGYIYNTYAYWLPEPIRSTK